MSKTINTLTATTKELVAFYNAHAHELGKKEVKKFADRETAQLRVAQMVADLEVEQEVEQIPSTLSVCLGLAPAPYQNEAMRVRKALADAINTDYEARHNAPYNLTACPECGSEEIYSGRCENGVVVDENLVGGCHLCEWEYDVRSKAKKSSSTGETREAMKTSLKLDRTIAAYDETGKVLGTWVNACRMWKQNLDWMTSAQQDGLTAKLYKAAKQGEKIRVVINGRGFELVTV